MQDRITIHQLTGKLVTLLKEGGFSESTIWRNYMPCVGSIEHYYEKLGQVYYDPQITNQYVELQRERKIRGEILGYELFGVMRSYEYMQSNGGRENLR